MGSRMRGNDGARKTMATESEIRGNKLDALRRDIDKGLKDVAKKRMVNPDLDDIMVRATLVEIASRRD